MKVKLKTNAAKVPALTPGNIYRVIGIEADDFRIMNDHGEPCLYAPRIFQVIDDSPGVDWEWKVGTEGERYAYAAVLAAPGFFEDYFDGKRRARMVLQAYLVRMATPARVPRGRVRRSHRQAA